MLVQKSLSLDTMYVQGHSYYSLLVNGEMLTDAVWYYPDPKPEADLVRGRVAFGNAVKVA